MSRREVLVHLPTVIAGIRIRRQSLLIAIQSGLHHCLGRLAEWKRNLLVVLTAEAEIGLLAQALAGVERPFVPDNHLLPRHPGLSSSAEPDTGKVSAVIPVSRNHCMDRRLRSGDCIKRAGHGLGFLSPFPVS